MPEIDYVEEIKTMINPDVIGHIRHLKSKGIDCDERQLCRFYGVATYSISRKFGIPTITHRKKLKKLEKEGLLVSCTPCKNMVLWWPANWH